MIFHLIWFPANKKRTRSDRRKPNKNVHWTKSMVLSTINRTKTKRRANTENAQTRTNNKSHCTISFICCFTKQVAFIIPKGEEEEASEEETNGHSTSAVYITLAFWIKYSNTCIRIRNNTLINTNTHLYAKQSEHSLWEKEQNEMLKKIEINLLFSIYRYIKWIFVVYFLHWPLTFFKKNRSEAIKRKFFKKK